MRTLGFLAVLAAGCGRCDLERMIEQQSYEPFEPSRHFEDGKVMRTPVPGTVSRAALLGPPELTDGLQEGTYVERIPVRVGRSQLERGQNRFQIFCAPCHGTRGDGVSVVARAMALRPPPSLVAEPIASYPAGRIYRAISGGFGLMPAYAEELDIADRWAIVAYVGALAISQGVRLDDLPESLKKEANRWLR